jgi:hypothetical protein
VDERVNGAIRAAVSGWKGARDDFALAHDIRYKIDGLLGFRRISFWLEDHPSLETIDTTRTSRIYAGLPVWKSMLRFFPHLAHTLNVAGVRVGSDKFTHMFSVGWEEYKRFRKNGVPAGLAYGYDTEAGVLGSKFEGIFSNGDLVADAEGLLFYRGLFEDGVVAGKSAMIRWDGDRPVVTREFTIRDHINEYWDEALNTCAYSAPVFEYVARHLKALCVDYAQNPALYDIDRDRDEELSQRYSSVGLKDNTRARLGAVCSALPGSQRSPFSALPGSQSSPF